MVLGLAQTRWSVLPWYLRLILPLRGLKIPPEPFFRILWHRSDPSGTAVAEVLAEFKLDSVSLRLAAGLGDQSASAPWTPEVQRAIERAQKAARETGASRLGAEHLWLGLLEEAYPAAQLQAANIDGALLQKHLRGALLSDAETPGPRLRFTLEARRVFAAARRPPPAAMRVRTVHTCWGQPNCWPPWLVWKTGSARLSAARTKPWRQSPHRAPTLPSSAPSRKPACRKTICARIS